MSSPILIYGADVSAASRAVYLTAQNLGLEIKRRDLDILSRENRQDWYKAINPQMLIPFMDDNGFTLAESRAITAYLVNSRAPGNSLYPTDAKKRAIVDQRLYFDGCTFFVRMDELWGHVLSGGTEITQQLLDKVHNALEHLNRFLTGNKYLAGDELTIADLHSLPLVAELYHLGAPLEKYPEVSRWWKLCETTVKGFEDNLNGAKIGGDFLNSKLIKKF